MVFGTWCILFVTRDNKENIKNKVNSDFHVLEIYVPKNIYATNIAVIIPQRSANSIAGML